MPFSPSGRPVGDADPLRVLIVDDSIVARTVFQRMLTDRAGFAVSGIARGADQALTMLADLAVDVILLDVEMPGVDGLTALPAILAAGKGAHVVIVSSACADGAVASVQALALGASDTLLKPAAGDLSNGFGDQLADRLRRLGRSRHGAPLVAPAARAQEQASSVRTDPIGCIAIGASTGGLVALASFFEGLGQRCAVPILVTQHLPNEFMTYFANQLAAMAGRPAMVAKAGQRIGTECILVAPGTAHLSLIRDQNGARITYDQRPAVSGCQPSVDPMLDAVADHYGGAGIGVILSGMGRDGMLGAGRLAAAGGEVLAQDATTATVWGMPGAVARAGIATTVLPPAALGRRIAARYDASVAAMQAMGAAVWR
ncbi:MAG TPA: chemotaxis protein CheB [Sphingomonas sp.]|jgi:two-component system chemotaxis response regulator CheB|uniref:chemotaxis protein CheB n=1 Tax=Sphingomonas sp. TaxID=28214 RepID=UPI002ED82203